MVFKKNKRTLKTDLKVGSAAGDLCSWHWLIKSQLKSLLTLETIFLLVAKKSGRYGNFFLTPTVGFPLLLSFSLNHLSFSSTPPLLSSALLLESCNPFYFVYLSCF